MEFFLKASVESWWWALRAWLELEQSPFPLGPKKDNHHASSITRTITSCLLQLSVHKHRSTQSPGGLNRTTSSMYHQLEQTCHFPSSDAKRLYLDPSKWFQYLSNFFQNDSLGILLWYFYCEVAGAALVKQRESTKLISERLCLPILLWYPIMKGFGSFCFLIAC